MPAPVKIYVASKIIHAEKWRNIRAEKAWGPNIEISSRWIDEAALGREDTCSNEVLGEVWKRNLEDIMHSDMVVVYAAAEDLYLRGALVEVGAALSWDLPIIACGLRVGDATDPCFGSWQFHPLVYRIRQDYDIWRGINAIIQAWQASPKPPAPEGGSA